MHTLNTNNNNSFQQAIINVVQDYLEFIGKDMDNEIQLIIDEKQHHYLLVETGWENNRRIYGNLIHIDIINDKIWIQQDGTEEGIRYCQ